MLKSGFLSTTAFHTYIHTIMHTIAAYLHIKTYDSELRVQEAAIHDH